MKVEVNEHGTIVLKEVYNPIKLISNDNETLIVSMRDSGFEICYENEFHELKNGTISGNSGLVLDKDIAIGLYRIFCGLSSSCYDMAEVYDSAKPGMKKTYDMILKYGADNNIDMRG